ncbi:MAG: cysteine desulfurase [Nanoarchaeota archaeon]|nr:cysteine desulfurase [Nanoarchaeota archaeon]|tara:strand:+ start:6253 stop:7482 length:1230 start_codon:yes stop_codon:yes gene_type:complete
MKQILNVQEIRRDFEVLNEKVNGKPLVYLDSGATSLTPRQVVESVNGFYNKFNANIHRGIHALSEKATIEYEEAHKKVGKFLNCKWQEVIFTKNTTESLNLLAFSLCRDLEEGSEILISEMEHHSNIVPWQELAKEYKLKLDYIKVKDGKLDLEDLENKLTSKTKIVSVTHMSNVLGTINPIKEISKIVHDNNSLLIVDSAQGVPHLKVDVKDLDVDFLAFSGHKMMGPTGIGVLYGKEELLTKMKPFMYGGDMISEVKFSGSKWNGLPWKFEAGTPMIAQGIGLGRAVEYLDKLGMDKIKEYEEYLTEYVLEKLNEIDKVKIYGPKDVKERGGVISFVVEGVHSHDVSTILDREGIAVRGGHMCAMPLVTEVLEEVSVCRASLYVYNTTEEIDKLVEGIKKVKEIFEV